MAFLEDYKAHTKEREALGVPPLALTAEQTAELVELLKASPIAEQDYAMDIFVNKIPAGVDDAAYVKAAFLNDVGAFRSQHTGGQVESVFERRQFE